MQAIYSIISYLQRPILTLRYSCTTLRLSCSYPYPDSPYPDRLSRMAIRCCLLDPWLVVAARMELIERGLASVERVEEGFLE